MMSTNPQTEVVVKRRYTKLMKGVNSLDIEGIKN